MAEQANITRRGAFGVVPALLSTGGTPHPDARLLALGRQLDAAWAAERKANLATGVETDPYVGACTEIVQNIEDVDATSMAGVMVKVKAFNWCRDDIGPWEDATTDMRLAEQIIEAVERLA
jgi:hypothetical protein